MCTDTHRDHQWFFDEWEDEDEDGGYAIMGGAIKLPSNIERFRQARQRGMSHGGIGGYRLSWGCAGF